MGNELAGRVRYRRGHPGWFRGCLLGYRGPSDPGPAVTRAMVAGDCPAPLTAPREWLGGLGLGEDTDPPGRPEDVPAAAGLMSENIPDPLGRAWKSGGWPGVDASSRHCPICGADHLEVAPRLACPSHGHLMQPWRGQLECPGHRCHYTAPIGGRADV